jgi:putative PIN family toxin of toxin-antitoxin system
MGPLRIVLDTNVIVSAALKPAGLERAVVVESFSPPAQTFVSDDMLWEYSRILSKPKLRITTARAAKLLSIIRARGHSIRPREHLSVCTDPDDNMFLRLRRGRSGRLPHHREQTPFPLSLAIYQNH